MTIGKTLAIGKTGRGLDLSIVDQDGRAMFPEGSRRPPERTRRLLEKLAPTLWQMPNRIAITGFTATEPMFPDNLDIGANRRVTVTLPKEAPPTPSTKGLP